MSPTATGAYTRAWDSLVLHFWVLLGSACVVALAIVPAYLISFASLCVQGDSREQLVLGVLLFLAQQAWFYAIVIPLEYGVFRILALTIRGGHPDLMDVFTPFRSLGYWLTVVGHVLLLAVITLALIVPVVFVFLTVFALAGAPSLERGQGILADAAGYAAALALVACVTPVIWWILCRIGISCFIVAEGRAGPIDAIGRAWKLTRGHAGTMFLIALLAVPVSLLGYLACCVGIIPACLLIGLAFAVAYVELTPDAASATAPSPSVPPSPAPWP